MLHGVQNNGDLDGNKKDKIVMYVYVLKNF